MALEKIGLPDACFSGGGGAGTEGADTGKGDVVGAAPCVWPCVRAWTVDSSFACSSVFPPFTYALNCHVEMAPSGSSTTTLTVNAPP